MPPTKRSSPPTCEGARRRVAAALVGRVVRGGHTGRLVLAGGGGARIQLLLALPAAPRGLTVALVVVDQVHAGAVFTARLRRAVIAVVLTVLA